MLQFAVGLLNATPQKLLLIIWHQTLTSQHQIQGWFVLNYLGISSTCAQSKITIIVLAD